MTTLLIIYVSCRPDQRHKQRPAFECTALKHPVTLMRLDQFLSSSYSDVMGMHVHAGNANVAARATVAT